MYQPYKYFLEIERPIAEIFSTMENRGVCVDLEYLKDLKDELARQKRPLDTYLTNELGNINLDSPKQLLEALNRKGLNPRNRKGPSTDKEAVSKLPDSELKDKIIARNELETLLSVFVNRYLERNETIVHPWFNQVGTRTGRPSCSNPNLLQIPRKTDNGKRVRRMFIPRPGMLMGDCDFGQIEPRVLAHLSKDKVLCQMFNDGIDFHTFTAKRLHIDRERAKVLNLSVGYRATKYSVQRQLEGSLDDAQKQIDSWWDLFPGLRRWEEELIYNSKKSGYCTTLFGRNIKVDGLDSYNSWTKEGAERQLINNICQGSAAEIMKQAMIKIVTSNEYDKWFSSTFGLLVQVYDELLFESAHIEADTDIVQYYMTNAVKLDVPLTVDCGIGSNWQECKE